MQKILKILRWIFTGATVGIIMLLCWQCLNIFLVGNSSENFVGGVYLTPVYSAQIVAERLTALSPLLAVYIILAVVVVILHLIWGKPQRNYPRTSVFRPIAPVGVGVIIGRIAVLGLGVLFILWGVLNGGAKDVLVKAINICTECIGLG